MTAIDECHDEYKCPITLCIMKDPVVLSDGHSYERKDLEKWLEKNSTSPKTNEKLVVKTFFPNHALAMLISKYLEKISDEPKSAPS
jgi:hypothetical protein